MAYVMLSRVQSIEQIYILDKLNSAKFYTDRKALEEHNRMQAKSINNNPTVWEKDGAVLKISLLNICSLASKFPDLAADRLLLKSDVIALGETWIQTDQPDPALSLPGYQLSLNSAGPGRGVATYFKPDKLNWDRDNKNEKIQISKISSFEDIDVINIYRSPRAAAADDADLVAKLGNLINQARFSVVVGDLNICYNGKRNHVVLTYLESLGFTQLTTKATHIAGNLLDLVFTNHGVHGKYEVTIQQYSPYYTYHDHNAVLVTVSLVSSFIL